MRRVLPGLIVTVALVAVGIGMTHDMEIRPGRVRFVPGTADALTPELSIARDTSRTPKRTRTRSPQRRAKPTRAKANPPLPNGYLVADAVRSSVPLYQAPNVPMAGGRALKHPTSEGLPVVFLVNHRRGNWINVRVSSRPNGLTAWVARKDVFLRRVPNQIVIELAARRITLLHGRRVLLRESVAVGRDGAPTPVGSFFVDGVVKMANPFGPYGVYQVRVSGFSDVYERFAGGVGQIALHGTNQPELLGQGVSAGCIRLTNDAVTRVVALAPLGTPVSILP